MRGYALGFLMALLLTGCGNTVGTELESFAAIDSTFDGWVVMGKFGPDGPFMVSEQTDYEMGTACRFEHGGTPHQYSGMSGYAYRVLRLDADGVKSTVLLRSAEQQ